MHVTLCWWTDGKCQFQNENDGRMKARAGSRRALKILNQNSVLGRVPFHEGRYRFTYYVSFVCAVMKQISKTGAAGGYVGKLGGER